MTRITLTPEERAAIRAQGGTAFVGVITFQRGRRGARYRPTRTAIFRSAERAQQALDAPQFRTLVAARTLHLVDANGELA
jgi:hypothetical protein